MIGKVPAPELTPAVSPLEIIVIFL